MKNTLILLLLSSSLILGCKVPPEKQPVVVAYVTSWKNSIPDPAYITHINYAFGHVNHSFNGIRIDNEERLRSILDLKKNKPTLKVLLSIGGWGSGGFSEMAASPENRRSFAADCKRVIDNFNLDGIDIDWEYPTSKVGGISASPDDTRNYTLMMQDIRKSIGSDHLLTLASDATAKFINFREIDPYIDFVNIMTYDINHPPYHHSPLYNSEFTKEHTCESSVNSHVEKGVPMEKLVLGIPFFGHAAHGLPEYISYGKIIGLEGYKRMWDKSAQVPYLVDSLGRMAITYDDPESIHIKCRYLKEKGMLGAMYWDYDGDDTNGSLRKAVYHGVMAGQ